MGDIVDWEKKPGAGTGYCVPESLNALILGCGRTTFNTGNLCNMYITIDSYCKVGSPTLKMMLSKRILNLQLLGMLSTMSTGGCSHHFAQLAFKGCVNNWAPPKKKLDFFSMPFINNSRAFQNLSNYTKKSQKLISPHPKQLERNKLPFFTPQKETKGGTPSKTVGCEVQRKPTGSAAGNLPTKTPRLEEGSGASSPQLMVEPQGFSYGKTS